MSKEIDVELHFCQRFSSREDDCVVLPDKLHYDSSEAEIWIEENCKEDGWNISPALRSQGSISHDNGVHTAHYTVYKYVE
jgi:hypothetical protein